MIAFGLRYQMLQRQQAGSKSDGPLSWLSLCTPVGVANSSTTSTESNEITLGQAPRQAPHDYIIKI